MLLTLLLKGSILCRTYVLDDQLQTALEICKLAAAEPQQYTALPDGSWKKN